jgi:hypothetical protein
MAGYRLYFVDEKGAIQAREEFVAANDADALMVSDLLYRACSDACYSYELWEAERRVIAFDNPRDDLIVAPTDRETIEIQQITLTLEEALLNSKWRLGRSAKLASEMQVLKERSEALLMRQRRTETP